MLAAVAATTIAPCAAAESRVRANPNAPRDCDGVDYGAHTISQGYGEFGIREPVWKKKPSVPRGCLGFAPESSPCSYCDDNDDDDCCLVYWKLGNAQGGQCCALSLEISECEELTRDVGCETPKDTDHQIPDVDVEICPPAPKKARGVSRMAMACSSAYEKPSQQDLGLSPCYLF